MSIIDKLKLNSYKHLVVLNQPDDYQIFEEQDTKLGTEHDAIFIFIETLHEMVEHTQRVMDQQPLLDGGYLFFAYPKIGNKRYDTSVHRDEIFPALKVGEDGYIGDSDLKFSRMVSMDGVFTVVGIKRTTKKAKKSSAASQRVADYADRIKEVEGMLVDHPQLLSFFQRLTPGYQKDWARHIFSAKQQSTRDKRVNQMIEVLSEGYKTIALYRQKKK
ncbi:YdeI/OmpD-associated family protein [Alkalicoccobacillus porphyridii]|uniref:YdeI/OmpD-associated family protein n=1 Tax=Alkalicoccobacillus porphyridii TaxID=2597270 RepID=A0A554A219_9BACI|nr:YdeI/OmpD-associated family protein [Alkalicoccobacillus porphyridii]TSB47733.1 YdeI/OmpD-associated family protein [Alkalicoccobacillus porphyridii]